MSAPPSSIPLDEAAADGATLAEMKKGVGDQLASTYVKEEVWGGKVFKVTTEIDNADLLLKPEMTGNAKIFCGDRRIFDLLTRRLARYIRVEFWSWW